MNFYKYFSRLSVVLLMLSLLPSSDPLSIISRPLIMDPTPPESCSQPVNTEWIAKVERIRWVAYSSPNPNPELGFYQPTRETIYQDLLTLKKAHFTGLVTYSSFGVMGRDVISIAESLGYDGMIMGVWDPANAGELRNAMEAASSPLVLGYTVGNEGLDRRRDRYSIAQLCSAISGLRLTTGKPATTSEEIDDYYIRPALLSVGDWYFPNAHPYWHFTKFPVAAVEWEQEEFGRFRRSTDRFILFREVGLPTEGTFGLSEANHEKYYRELAKTDVRFVYFEAFDQPSKNYATVEPHWGLFRSSRKPKLLAWNLIGSRPFTSTGLYDGWIRACSETSAKGCALHSNGTLLQVGHDAENRQTRAFISFNTSALPDNAVIRAVTLKIKLAGIVGTGFNQRQKLIVDACAPFFGSSPKLQAADFEATANCKELGTFGNQPERGWYVADLDRAAFAFIQLQGITQFRLRISPNDNRDKRADYFRFYSGLADDANRPFVLVGYSIP